MYNVPQRTDIDCGEAAAATLAECGLDYASERAAKRKCGLRPSDVAKLLGALTGTSWTVTRAGYRRPLGEVVLPPRCAVLIRKRGGKIGSGHWVAVAGGRVYDPEQSRGVPLVAYRRCAWLVLRVLLPTASLGLSGAE